MVGSVCEAWTFGDPLKDQTFRVGDTVGAGGDVLTGDRRPTSAIEARWMMGNDRPPDVVWSGGRYIVLLSRQAQAVLTRAGCSGWHALPARLIGKQDEAIEGFAALVITGRVGPADYSLARVVWREFPGGRYPYLKGCVFTDASWDGSDLFMERPQPGQVQPLRIYASARAAAALRNGRIKNVRLERLSEHEAHVATIPEIVKSRWPVELRQQLETGSARP